MSFSLKVATLMIDLSGWFLSISIVFISLNIRVHRILTTFRFTVDVLLANWFVGMYIWRKWQRKPSNIHPLIDKITSKIWQIYIHTFRNDKNILHIGCTKFLLINCISRSYLYLYIRLLTSYTVTYLKN